VNLGAENRKKTIIAVILFAVAMIMTIRMFSGSSSSSDTPVVRASQTEPTVPAPPGRKTSRRTPKSTNKTTNAGPVTPNLDPRLRINELREAETTEYTGKGRNIFRAQSDPEIPKPIETGFKKKPEPVPDPGPPPPPPPPPINLKFFGIASQQGSRKAILSSGDDVFVVAEGEIVQRRYKIVKLNPTSIEVQDVLNNNLQTIPLTAG
jgi:hypothetical protein